MRSLFVLLVLANVVSLAVLLTGGDRPSEQPGYPEGGSLVLVRELGGAAESCFLSGPLTREEDAWLLAGQYRGGVEVLSREEEQAIGWRVFLPPHESLDDARRSVRRLQEAGVDDVGLVTDPELANAVSIGVFSSRELAERRRIEVQRRGFEPRVEERVRKRTRYRLLLGSDQPPEGDEMMAWQEVDCQEPLP